MNSLVVTHRLGATLTCALFVLSALAADRGSAGKDFTLLTGPYLLSPPTRPLNASSISSEVVKPGQPPTTVEQLHQKNRDAEKRVQELRAELAELRERNKKAYETVNGVFRAPATPANTESIRFDARAPVTGTDLLRFDSTLHPPPSPPTFQFRATVPMRE